MKKQSINDFLNELIGAEWFTALHYRIIIYLINHKATQAQISRDLKSKPSNVNKACKELISSNVLEVVEVAGRNKILTTNTNWSNNQIKGQMSINEIL